jgi:ADP-heptose:LPS heptosyltransferase
MGHWNRLCDLIAERLPQYAIVQHTHKDSTYFVSNRAIPHSPTTFRETCGLLASAECYIRGESGLLHAAAALGVPSVAIWGGCMDWEVMGGYPKEVGVGISEPCCGSWKACEHCARVMGEITPESVLEGLVEALTRRSCASPAEVGVE